MKITFAGSGNLATRLSLALKHSDASPEFCQVYSPTFSHAQRLAEQLGAEAVADPSEIKPGADLYVFSLKDACLADVLARVPDNGGLWVHTSGSLPMDIFCPRGRRGVFYPLQTFSKQREVDFREIPIFLEASAESDAEFLRGIASCLSRNVRFLDSERRRNLHLAAVFACNFANHIYHLADTILKEAGLPFDILLPLIDETAAKVHALSPLDAQTGPAVRYDANIIDKHLAMLPDPERRQIYRLLSQSIFKAAQRHEHDKL